MTVHDIRHKLNDINKQLIFTREISTQCGVIQEIDRTILAVCCLGDELEDKLDKV